MTKYWYYLKSIFELILGFRHPWQIIRVFLTSSREDRQIVIIKNPSVSMKVRGKMDIWSIKETFIDRFYSKYGCESGNDWTVVDIGAAIGEYCIYVAVSHPGTRIIAYEPFQDSVDLLRENLRLNGITNVELHPLAVWNKATTLTLDLSQQEPLMISSNTKPSRAGISNHVKAVSLVDVLKMNKLEHVDLVKMDCEGAEYDILLGSDAATIQAFTRIVMEYHDGVGEKHHTQLVSTLERLGYHVSVKQNAVHPDIGYLFAELV